MIEENNFTKEAISILTSLGFSTADFTEEELNSVMKEKGYKKGYSGAWIMPDDIILDEEYRA